MTKGLTRVSDTMPFPLTGTPKLADTTLSSDVCVVCMCDEKVGLDGGSKITFQDENSHHISI
jgi:hypothetical protein